MLGYLDEFELLFCVDRYWGYGTGDHHLVAGEDSIYDIVHRWSAERDGSRLISSDYKEEMYAPFLHSKSWHDSPSDLGLLVGRII